MHLCIRAHYRTMFRTVTDKCGREKKKNNKNEMKNEIERHRENCVCAELNRNRIGTVFANRRQ